MIDITVDIDKVEVDMKVFYFDYSRNVNNQAEMLLLLEYIIDKVKYSGESITLCRADFEEDTKRRIKEW